MGLVDKFKGMFSSIDDEYDEDEVDFISNDNSSNATSPQETSQRRSTSIRAYDEMNEEKENKVVNIHATTQLQVILVKPEQFEEVSAIADHLNSKRTVVLNLESTTKELSRRLIDFLSGVAYANNGQVKRVANSTFIITPYNVDIKGDLLDELENNGVYF
ncbi:MAG: cell division protein SepF [Oscillospiraceae bacterium]